MPALSTLEEKAYHLLFIDERPINNRVKDLAILLKPLFQNPSASQPKIRGLPLPGNEMPFDDPLEENDMKEIAKELEDLFPDDELMNKMRVDDNKKLLRQLRRRRALGLALPKLESSAINLKMRMQSGMWTPGKAATDLDLKSSIASFGRIIPGETTLGIKSVEGALCTDGVGFQLTMLLDVSRSMNRNNRVERMIDAAVALNRAAKKNSYSVSIITFGERARMIQQPTLDHAAAEETIFELNATEDDTNIYPALQMIKSSHRKPLVYILTDAGIYDIIERNVAESIRKITGEGKCILFLIGYEEELDDDTRTAFRAMTIEVNLVPDNEDYTGTIVKSALQL